MLDQKNPSAQDEPRSLHSFVTFRLARVQNRLNAQAAATLKRHCDLSLTEWRALSLINDGRRTTAATICRVAQMDKGQISRALKRLQDRGLLETVDNDDDHREMLLSLSASGQELYDRLVSIMRRRQKRLIRDLSDTELATFFEVLEKLEAKASEPVT